MLCFLCLCVAMAQGPSPSPTPLPSASPTPTPASGDPLDVLLANADSSLQQLENISLSWDSLASQDEDQLDLILQQTELQLIDIVDNAGSMSFCDANLIFAAKSKHFLFPARDAVRPGVARPQPLFRLASFITMQAAPLPAVNGQVMDDVVNSLDRINNALRNERRQAPADRILTDAQIRAISIRLLDISGNTLPMAIRHTKGTPALAARGGTMPQFRGRLQTALQNLHGQVTNAAGPIVIPAAGGALGQHRTEVRDAIEELRRLAQDFDYSARIPGDRP
jgi:hypothetical protein